MKYLGGKEKISKELSAFLESIRLPNQRYVEPFVGGCSVFSKMQGEKVAGDVHPDLIAMYQALQQGWIPPDAVSEEQYKKLKASTTTSALRGFVGFCCSFGGKWFGGYAREGARNFALNGKNSLLKIVGSIVDVEFVQGDYQMFSGELGSLIYCDIPYKGTTTYKTAPFEYEKFYAWVREMSESNTVVVSEYNMPDDFEVVWEIERNLELKTNDKNKKRIERLFQIKK